MEFENQENRGFRQLLRGTSKRRFNGALMVLAVLLIVFFLQHREKKADNDPADLVNPLMGTDSDYKLSNGNTYPAIALPWGMNFWTPQTGKMGNGWAYPVGGCR